MSEGWLSKSIAADSTHGFPLAAGVKVELHLAASSGIARMLVVV